MPRLAALLPAGAPSRRAACAAAAGRWREAEPGLVLLAGQGKGVGLPEGGLRRELRAGQAVEAAEAVERRAGGGCAGRERGQEGCKLSMGRGPQGMAVRAMPGRAGQGRAQQTQQAQQGSCSPVDGEGSPQELNPHDSACASWPQPLRLLPVRLGRQLEGGPEPASPPTSHQPGPPACGTCCCWAIWMLQFP